MRSAHASARTIAGAVLFATLGACASAEATQGNVSDKWLEHPPYYTGKVAPDAGCIAHLPIAYQRGGTNPEIFDPKGGEGTPIGSLLAEMNAYLESLAATKPLALSVDPPGRAPDVHFGCETDASGDCIADEAHDARKPQLRLAVDGSSKPWTAWLQSTLYGAGASRALVITLEVSQYWTHQKNFRGDKEVELGTGHAVSLPWLTSLETPVSVLQLTGALVTRQGKAVRIGAEGLLARRTSLVASSFGAQALITDEEVERLRASRRDDLPGGPLVWKTALEKLVAGLTGAAEGTTAACP